MEGTLTEDALLGGRVQLLQPARGYRVAIDAVLLPGDELARVDVAERVDVDLGTAHAAVPLDRARLRRDVAREREARGGMARRTEVLEERPRRRDVRIPGTRIAVVVVRSRQSAKHKIVC